MIVTFYSYKGGVGRTQLCANIANYLCHEQNKRVLLWDWDFEAPGIHYFFKKKEASSAAKGTLEIFEQYVSTLRKLKTTRAAEETESPVISGNMFTYPRREDMVNMLDKPNSETGKCIDLMTAGNYSDDFSYRSGNFDWMEFYQYMDGAAYVELLKAHIKTLGYDYILIDSRTGISDYSGICNIQLPDVNVMVIAATMQNFDGCLSIIEKIRSSPYMKIKGKQAKILPILSRIEANSQEYSKWVKKFILYFSNTIENLDSQLETEMVDAIFRDIYFRDTVLPYKGAIAIGEQLFTHGNTSSDTEYKTPFINIAKLIEDLNPDRLTRDSLGNSTVQNGEINFYGKVAEENWNKYAVEAEDMGNGRVAAIAFNQIGIKEADPIKKLAYFQKAVKNDQSYEKAHKNLNDYYETYNISNGNPENTATTTIFEVPPVNKVLPKKSLLSPLVKISLGIILTAIILYLVYNTGKNQQIAIQAGQDSIPDTASYAGPLLKGSDYFDSLRNMGKAIGLDISSNENIYDQSKVIQYGINFMLIKATEGKAYVDPSFSTNWITLRNKKFVAGAYHYYSLKTDPVLQADNFIKNVVISAGDLPPILNLFALEEVSIDPAIIAGVNTYLDRINLYYGMKPIIYVSEKVAGKLFSQEATRYYLWLNKPNAGIYYPPTPKLWNKWKFWQFSTQEKFDGILVQRKDRKEDFVDVNQFNGTKAELKAMTFKTSSGVKALRAAYSLFTGRSALYNTLASGKVVINRDTLAGLEFKKTKFYWSTQLINHCYKILQTKNLYGKSHQELLTYLQKNKLISRSSQSVINLGDVVFFDFEEKKGIQASGIVFNMDATYLYCIEGSDIKGKLSISRFRRHRGDVYLAATLKDK